MQLIKANEADFCTIYEDMKQQFPYVEIKAKETFLTILRHTEYDVWLAKDSINGKTENVGYMLVWLDRKNRFIWLEYIAVFNHFHSRGLGSKMLRLLKAEYLEVKGCFLELEKPSRSDLDSKRRVAFYTKKGAFPLNYRYFYPQHRGALALDLYFLPFQNGICSLPQRDISGTIQNAFDTLHYSIPTAKQVLQMIRPLQQV